MKFFQHAFRIEGAFRQKVFRRDLRFIDAQDILYTDLHFSLIERRLSAHADEIILIESPAQVIGAVPHPGFDLAAAVDQPEG